MVSITTQVLKLLDTPHNEFMVLGITLNIYFLNFEEKSISMGLGMLLTKVKLEKHLEALALLGEGKILIFSATGVPPLPPPLAKNCFA